MDQQHHKEMHHGHHHHHEHTKPAAQNEHVYHKHAGHHTENFLRRFWICLALTIPVLLLSHMMQQWIGFELPFPGAEYVLLLLSTIIYFYGGWPFLNGMISEIRYRNIGMMTLIALAITVAFVYSISTVMGLPGMDFFWELATLIDIMLLGHWLEMRSEMAASHALQSLVTLLPDVVHVMRHKEVVDIPLKELQNDEIIIIKPGEKIPADGTVTEGKSYVNESVLTGESAPVLKERDKKVIAGSLNGDGAMKVRVTGTGRENYLAKVIRLVESAQRDKSRTQNLADKIARWLTIISILVGIATFAYWLTTRNELPFALERMVTVMVTSCPHALGVAIPLVVALSTSVSAAQGLLVRNRTAFENAGKLTTIIFDKTGTLTKGSHELQRIILLGKGYNENEILQYAAAAEQHSEHYIGRGILKKLKDRNLELWPPGNFEYTKGMGVTANVRSKKVTVAGPSYFSQHKLPMPELPGSVNRDIETVLFVLIDDMPAGIITMADTLRETAAEAIKMLASMNIKSFLLTGDNERIAAAVTKQLRMNGYLANVLPHEKQNKVKEFQEKGEVVAMTGDGVNDAPALAQADIGIAIGSGTDVAAETADIILVNSDPRDVVKIISFGKATYRKMLQNLGWAAGYNIFAIPLAAGVLYPSFTLSPAMGAVLMSLSTIIVAINARLLKLK